MYIEKDHRNVALAMGLVPALSPFPSNSWVCERVTNWLVFSRRLCEEHPDQSGCCSKSMLLWDSRTVWSYDVDPRLGQKRTSIQ